MSDKAGAKLTQEERIAKLLQKAETTTPEEAELLTAKAVELMQKYGVTQAMLNARRTGDKERIELLQIPLKGIYAMAYESMLTSIARAYGNVQTFYTQWKQSDVTLTITGFESDVAQLKVLLTSLQLQVVVATDSWWKSADNEYTRTSAKPMEKFKARRQFIKSFGFGAAERIRKARHHVVAEAEKSTPGTELVLRNRAQAVDEFVTAKFPGLKTVKRREKPGSFGAGQAGYKAGQNANTGDKQVSNQRALNA
jgi:hypothetical protein